MELRPTVIEIDTKKLKLNYKKIANFVAPAKVLASLKANAYGHGLEDCAKVLENEGCEWFAVAFIEEAISLRQAGIKGRVLVMGGLYAGQIDEYFNYDLDFTVSSILKLKQVEERAIANNKIARVHLKIDTGLERVGVHYYSANEFIEYARSAKNIEVVGIYSHLALANPNDNSYTETQIQRFKNVCDLWVEKTGKKALFHIANSGALNCKNAHMDLVRPGIALYGGMKFPNSELDVQPILSLKSKIVYFKVVKKGAGVSYGHRWIADCDTRIVTIPIGYGDGYMRSLSNKADVLIRGKRYPIVGSICMDQLMVNLGPDGEGYVGDEVVLIGKQGKEEITADELAEKVGTINYEILTNLNQRIPRVFV
jgi:alanine racemase